MTKEQMRIAIAEACGVVECHEWVPSFHPLAGLEKRCAHKSCYPSRFGPPRYDEDLNACAEMRKRLTEEQKGDYIDYLSHGFTEEFCDLANGFDEAWGWINITAPQHCEAFLRAIGKWVP